MKFYARLFLASLSVFSFGAYSVSNGEVNWNSNITFMDAPNFNDVLMLGGANGNLGELSPEVWKAGGDTYIFHSGSAAAPRNSGPDLRDLIGSVVEISSIGYVSNGNVTHPYNHNMRMPYLYFGLPVSPLFVDGDTSFTIDISPIDGDSSTGDTTTFFMKKDGGEKVAERELPVIRLGLQSCRLYRYQTPDYNTVAVSPGNPGCSRDERGSSNKYKYSLTHIRLDESYRVALFFDRSGVQRAQDASSLRWNPVTRTLAGSAQTRNDFVLFVPSSATPGYYSLELSATLWLLGM